MSTWPSPRVDRLGTPKTPAIRFTRAMTFVASWFTHLLRPASLLASLNGSDRISPAIGGFYVRASGGSVTLPAAGYDYNSDWTPLLAGLSPARMTTSLAAPTPSSQGTCTLYSLPVSRRLAYNFRLASESGHSTTESACPFRANKRHRLPCAAAAPREIPTEINRGISLTNRDFSSGNREHDSAARYGLVDKKISVPPPHGQSRFL